MLRDLGAQTRRAAHVFALQDVDQPAVRPADIAQITAQRRRSCARGRIFVHATERKRVAGMKHLIGFCPGQQNRCPALTHHQLAPGLLVVMHGLERCAAVQRQNQMPGTAVYMRWRDALIQIAVRIAEQRQRFFQQLRADRFAERGRRLQRSRRQRTLSMPLDRDLCLIEGQIEHTVALLRRQDGTQRNGGMTAERHFGQWREVTHSPAVFERGGEHGFGKADVGRDLLHAYLIRQRGTQPYTRRITALIAIAERGQFEYFGCHELGSLPWSGAHSVLCRGADNPVRKAGRMWEIAITSARSV
ncbi:hypothetical protein ALQ23_05592 [Pseudomonas syringae pv. antirrhini]|nr:hypothetical protein ALQ23_05592 [Pseudomonas syringae pv. antirrhini]